MDNIERLKKTLDAKRADRALLKARDEKEKARINEINAAAKEVMTSFWCKECKRDFDAWGIKRLNWGYDLDRNETYLPKLVRAWYYAKCPNGHQCIRHITDKVDDPYYRESMFIRRERSEHADDFLTPDDPRFRIKYPQAWARLEKEKELREAANGTTNT